jgi:hypothetical protein
MSAPKSVVKVKKGNVEYTSNVDAAQYYIHELTRAALRDVAKFVKAEFKRVYYEVFEKHSGKAGRVISYKVISSKSTTAPRVQIGLSGKKIDGFYAFYQEFGSSKTPKVGMLSDVVESNIPKIIEIESKYLSGLEDEARALSMVDEEEYEDDGE